jgi:hypothetical protein
MGDAPHKDKESGRGKLNTTGELTAPSLGTIRP